VTLAAENIDDETAFDPADAPVNTNLLCWGAVGWRFMRRRTSGQWENMMGNPLQAPKGWRPVPPAPVRILPGPK
jgi:hypothetical protein